MELKIHPHITKAVAIYFAVLIVVSLGILFFAYRYSTKTPATVQRQELPTPNFKVSEYSLSGKITDIKDNTVTMNVIRIFAGPNGNYPASEQKTVTITPKTPVTLVSTVNNKMVRKVGKISDLTVGQNIVVYSFKNIALESSFTPVRIDVLVSK